jgi:hypothetical protein
MQTTPTERASRRQVIRDWLDANPGWHRPRDVSQGADLPSHGVAVDLIHLADAGHILRKRRTIPNRKHIQSLYASPLTKETS